MSSGPPRPAWMLRVEAELSAAAPTSFDEFAPPPGVERRAAVLMLFSPHPGGGEDVVLTERAATLRSHPGQVSFPGGRVDEGDEHSVAAALREAEEEVGLEPSGVDVVLTLPELYLSPSQNAVTPVLAWCPVPGELRAVDEAEVARVVRVPVSDLLDPARRFTAVFGPYKGAGFEVGDVFVWGFTARLLDELFDLAGLTVPWDRSVERPLPDRVMSPWMRGLSGS